MLTVFYLVLSKHNQQTTLLFSLFLFPFSPFPRDTKLTHTLLGMAIRLDGPACVAVNQDSMYVVNLMGYQSNDQSKPLLALIKTEYPTTATGNNTWSVVSTTPQSFFVPDTKGILYITCDVDNNGVVTLRYENGAGYIYDPLAPKSSKTQTCSSASNGLGEWRRADLVLPDDITGWRRHPIRGFDLDDQQQEQKHP